MLRERLKQAGAAELEDAVGDLIDACAAAGLMRPVSAETRANILAAVREERSPNKRQQAVARGVLQSPEASLR